MMCGRLFSLQGEAFDCDASELDVHHGASSVLCYLLSRKLSV